MVTDSEKVTQVLLGSLFSMSRPVQSALNEPHAYVCDASSAVSLQRAH